MPPAVVAAVSTVTAITAITATSDTTARPVYVTGVFYYAMEHRIVDFHPDMPPLQ